MPTKSAAPAFSDSTTERSTVSVIKTTGTSGCRWRDITSASRGCEPGDAARQDNIRLEALECIGKCRPSVHTQDFIAMRVCMQRLRHQVPVSRVVLEQEDAVVRL